MNLPFSVQTSPHFERIFRKLSKQHTELLQYFTEVIEILEADPHNRSHRYAIKKLSGQQADHGQWRLRYGRWRFRYDIVGQVVELKYCGLRREDTYH
jgi:mRNA-degrading endonuclease RelE of RelBE toxin-antitoxin system